MHRPPLLFCADAEWALVQGAVINKMILPAKTIGSDVPHRTASTRSTGHAVRASNADPLFAHIKGRLFSSSGGATRSPLKAGSGDASSSRQRRRTFSRTWDAY